MAGKGNTVSAVTALVKPSVDDLGLILWDVVFEKEGASWFLRVFIDKDGIMEVDDCEAVSKRLNPLLDETDPIEQSYYLEVSSAGLGRRLKRPEHFARFLGDEVTVKLYRAVDKRKEFVGVLAAFEDNTVVLREGEQEHRFAIGDCAYVKLNDDLDLF